MTPVGTATKRAVVEVSYEELLEANGGDSLGLVGAVVQGPDVDHLALRDRLTAALPRLPESEREVVPLRGILGLSHAEVGKTLGISEAAAQKRWSRATQTLRPMLLDFHRAHHPISVILAFVVLIGVTVAALGRQAAYYATSPPAAWPSELIEGPQLPRTPRSNTSSPASSNRSCGFEWYDSLPSDYMTPGRTRTAQGYRAVVLSHDGSGGGMLTATYAHLSSDEAAAVLDSVTQAKTMRLAFRAHLSNGNVVDGALRLPKPVDVNRRIGGGPPGISITARYDVSACDGSVLSLLQIAHKWPGSFWAAPIT